jgi:zinc protease
MLASISAHHLRRTVLASCLLALGTVQATPLPAAALPKGVTVGPSVEGITEYRLPNGLKVLLLPDNAKPTVAVNITYLVGSRHENYGESGMAHLLEHMLFKGTPTHKNITEAFNQRGFRMNGTTSSDRTNYFELFQASDDNLKWALELEADRMVNSNVARKDLDTEMTVVRNEFERGENSPAGVLFKRMQSIAYDWHNYGNSTIGNRSDIEHVKIENLQNFYHQYYQPDNAVLLVAGKFNPAKTMGWIVNAFGKIPKPKRSLPEQWTVEPTQDGERSFTVRRKGDVQFVAVVYKSPFSLHRDSDFLGYATNILANTPSSRLHKQLVEPGKAVQVAPLAGFMPGLNGVMAVVKKGEPVEPVRDAIVAAMEQFGDNLPTPEEVERVRRDNLNEIEKLLTDHESIGIAMSEAIAQGDWRLLFQSRDKEGTITAEQVAKAAKTYFRRDNRTVGTFLPEDSPQRAEIPAQPSATEAMADFKPKAELAAVEIFDPSPANIDQRTVHKKVGGIDVTMLAKKSRGETVSVALDLLWGDEKSRFGTKWIGTLTNEMLSHGSSKYSRAQLADEMAKLKMTGEITAFDTTRANLPGALALMAHVMRSPNFTENELAQVKKEILTQYESQRNEPQAVAANALNAHTNRYPKGDVRAAESIDDSIAAINAVTLDQIKAYHKQFYGASNGRLALVGDFEVGATLGLIEQGFADWKSASPYTRLSRTHFDVPPLVKNINTPDKENGSYRAQLNLPLKDTDPDYPALYVANYIFGGAGLDSRIMQRIRQKEGLSYGGGSSLQADTFDASGRLGMGAIAAPQNLAKVDASLKDELAKILKDGFSKEELARAKSGILQKRVQERTTDAALATSLNSHQETGRSFAWEQAFDDKISKLTVEQVNAAFKKWIDPAKLSIVIARDEAKATGGK